MIDPKLTDLWKLVKAEEIVPLTPPPVHDALWWNEYIQNFERHIQEHLDWLDWKRTQEEARY